MKSKKMRIMMVLLMTAFLMPASWAQSTVTKEAKKQAKAFKKEGWTVNKGDKTLEEQVADFLYYTNHTGYIVESATQKSKTYHSGLTSASARANGAIVRRMNTLIASVTTVSQTNLQGGDGETESKVALEGRIKSLSLETLKSVFPVLVMSRELPDGTCEVQVHQAIAIPEELKGSGD
ncbi:MAG: hypothetical protein J6X07_02310 [Prevotella sp.]|nr:hypothetical protein [Prevotella sp.]